MKDYEYGDPPLDNPIVQRAVRKFLGIIAQEFLLQVLYGHFHDNGVKKGDWSIENFKVFYEIEFCSNAGEIYGILSPASKLFGDVEWVYDTVSKLNGTLINLEITEK